MNLAVESPADLGRLRTMAGRSGIRSISVPVVDRHSPGHDRMLELSRAINRDLNVCGCIPAAIAVAVGLGAYVAAALYMPANLPESLAERIAVGFGVALGIAAVTKVTAMLVATVRLNRNITRLTGVIASAR
ncbi:MAG: hypothetical protein Q8N31_20020 [Reyranella sp.]|nr:hypothetical protein [Reyranella sp.]MDP3162306.1 hypothetical protein [Reyranella sp.]